MSITPVGARFLIPSSIIGPSDGAKPASAPNAIGTVMSAVSGDIRRVMMSAMKVATMAKARKVSMTSCASGAATGGDDGAAT